MPSGRQTVQPNEEVIAISPQRRRLVACTPVPPTQFICRGAGNWLRFGSKTAIRAILGDRKQENPGCLESFLEDGLKNAGFFWSFMAKNEVRSETPRNTVRFPLLFSTE